jgi:outer membrane protein assembly factor BamD
MSHSSVKSLLLSAFLLLSVVSCSSTVKDTNTPEGAFQAAEEYDKDELYDEALQKFSEVKNKYPYSRYAAEAELRIADIHYKREAWIEAQNAYQLFKDLHPKHPKIAYVTHRLAMSYFNQLPTTIDRDLTVADKAILFFDDVIKNYDKSEFVEEAKTKRAEARKMQGEKMLYIAEFYYIRDIYDSALLRYETLLKDFTAEGFAPKALLGAGISAFEIGERAKGEQYLNQLVKSHSGTAEAEKGEDALRKYGVH